MFQVGENASYDSVNLCFQSYSTSYINYVFSQNSLAIILIYLGVSFFPFLDGRVSKYTWKLHKPIL
jgi:hypothetical protein